jgi:hypothetical protein
MPISAMVWSQSGKSIPLNLTPLMAIKLIKSLFLVNSVDLGSKFRVTAIAYSQKLSAAAV